MKLVDRLLTAVVLVVVAAVALPAAVPPLATLAVVVTFCLVVLQAARHYLGRY
jgi:hypothetical protein